MDKLTQAKIFITTVELGSLARAAEHLEISIISARRNITALEEWLNISLLDRTGTNLKLTEAGRSAYLACQDLLNKTDELIQQVTNLNKEPRGRLRIATSQSFAEAGLTDALAGFRDHYPEIEFTLVVSDTPPNMAAERIDLAMIIGPLLEPQMIAKYLFTSDIIFCTSPAYVKNYGIPSNPQELEQCSFVTHTQHEIEKLQFWYKESPVRLNVQTCFSSNDTAIIRSAVSRGMGIALLPHRCIEKQLNDGTLVHVLPDLKADSVDMYAAYLSRQNQPIALRLLVDYLANFFNKFKTYNI